MNRLPVRTFTLSMFLMLTACASIPKPPPGSEDDRSFTASTSIGYQDAYRSVAWRSSACFAQGGIFSVNHQVQADLDAVEKIGRVEVFPVGLYSGTDKDSDRKSYVTTIKAKGDGAEVTTTGRVRNTAYLVNLLNMQWIAGMPACSLQR